MDARYKIAEAMMRGVGQPMAAFPDQRQDDDMSLRGMASDLYQADQRRAQDYRAGIKEAILQSWPAELAKVPYNFADFANRVYQGKADPMSDEAIQRSADIAGLMTLGAGAVPAGANELRAGLTRKTVFPTADNLVKELEAAGLRVARGQDSPDGISRSVTNFGASAYVKPHITTPNGVNVYLPEVRVSDHSTGSRRYGDYVHLNDDDKISDVVSQLKGLAGRASDQYASKTKDRSGPKMPNAQQQIESAAVAQKNAFFQERGLSGATDTAKSKAWKEYLAALKTLQAGGT
jgi:hypothetical protein